jgi:hypothetical protein
VRKSDHYEKVIWVIIYRPWTGGQIEGINRYWLSGKLGKTGGIIKGKLQKNQSGTDD